MKLTLNNFKSWENKVFDLGNTGITLLDGISGQGKSTLFQAIIFALYGTGNKLITFGKKKMKVIFEFDNMKIERSKGPNKLIVDNKYIDDEGQELINNKFSNVFDIIGYIEQKSINNFITMSPSDKLAFIERFAFQDINLIEIKKKIKKISSERTNNLNNLKGELTMIDKIIDDMDEKYDLDDNEFPIDCDDEDIPLVVKNQSNKIANCYTRINKFNKKINELLIKINDGKHNNEKIKEIQTNIDKYNNLLSNIEYIGDNELNKYKKTISNYNKFQDIKTYNKLESTINKLKEQIKDINKNEIDKLSTKIDNYNNYIKYNKQLNELSFDKQELKEKKKQLEFKYIQCPSCKSNLSISNKDEVKICKKKVGNKDELKKEVKKLEDKYIKYKTIQSKLDEITDDFNDFDINLNQITLDNLYKVYEEQTNIKREIKLNEKQQNKLNIDDFDLDIDDNIDYNNIQDIININSTNKKLIKTYNNELETYKSKNNQLIYIELNDIEKEICDFKDKIKEQEEKLEELNETQKEIDDYFEKEKLIDNYNDYIDKKEEIEAKLKKIENSCLSIEILKKKINIAQNIAIENIIETIEISSQHYIDKFFLEPMVIKLNTFSKTNKPQINLDIFYKDNDTEFKSLSGGEQDRLILAFTLALSELFNTKLILLDEIISSLDIESTTSIIETIKDNIQDKLVIFIAHQIVNGHFDLIVKL